MNTAYRELTLARVKATVEAANAVMKVKHKGLKGQLREIVTRELFRPLLPTDIGVGTGEIISADNRHSRQQDIVIYDKSILPPILLEGVTGIFPVESVLYTVEVKSILTASEIQTSHISATELLGFVYQSGEHDALDKPVAHPIEQAISTILAFDTDLALGGKNELDRYNEICGSDIPTIRAICVVGRGHWLWHKVMGWKEFPWKHELDELVSFVAVVMNTYRRIAATRKVPRLGRYLIDG